MFVARVVCALSLAWVAAADINCMQPLDKSPDECCPAMPMFVTEDVIQSCGMKPDDPSPGPPPCEPFACILRKANLLGADGKVNRANAMSVAKSLYGPEWTSAIDVSVPKCLQMIETSPSGCEARQFSTCFIQNMLLNCPASHWTAVPACEVAKNFLSSCVPPPM